MRCDALTLPACLRLPQIIALDVSNPAAGGTSHSHTHSLTLSHTFTHPHTLTLTPDFVLFPLAMLLYVVVELLLTAVCMRNACLCVGARSITGNCAVRLLATVPFDYSPLCRPVVPRAHHSGRPRRESAASSVPPLRSPLPIRRGAYYSSVLLLLFLSSVSVSIPATVCACCLDLCHCERVVARVREYSPSVSALSSLHVVARTHN